MNRKTKLLLGLIPVLLVFVVIFIFSSFDASSSSSQSGVIVKFLKKYIFTDLNDIKSKHDIKLVNDTLAFAVRKTAHFSVYMLLGGITFASMWIINNKKLRYLAALAICAGYAATDEFHQSFVPGRSCELRDVMIDSCGAAIGAGVCLVIVLLLELRQIKKSMAAQTGESYNDGNNNSNEMRG